MAPASRWRGTRGARIGAREKRPWRVCLLLLWCPGLCFQRSPFQAAVVQRFFEQAEDAHQHGRPMRFQLTDALDRLSVFAEIAQQVVTQQPMQRCALVVSSRVEVEQLLQELAARKLRACFLCSSVTDVAASVVVCTYQTAKFLKGQRFHVKILDWRGISSHTSFAHRLRNEGTATIEAEFAPAFRFGQIDYMYPLTQATAEGLVQSLHCFLMPIWPRCSLQQKLANAIRLKEQDWSPMLVSFQYHADAKSLADRLCALGVQAAAAACQDSEKLRQLTDGQLSVLCVTRGFSGLPSGLRCLLCVSRNTRKLALEAMNMRDRVSKVDYVQMFCAPGMRWAQRGRLSQEQLEMLEPFWVYISATGVEERRAVCLEELCAWLRHHKRKPRYFALCAGLNESELEEQLAMLEPFWAYISVPDVHKDVHKEGSKWLKELCAWLLQHKRKPRYFDSERRSALNETQQEERQANRCRRLRCNARKGHLSQVGLVPIANGIIIDNLAAGQSIEQVWSLMYMVRDILDLHGVGGQGVRESTKFPGKGSGFISVPDVDISSWDRQPLKRLAAMAPGSTLKVMKQGSLEREFRLQVPPRVYNFKDISCKNTACVSHASQMQHEVEAFFERCRQSGASREEQQDALAFNCKYCETQHTFWEIWNYEFYRPTEFAI
ncbi:unnamed protein product [Effrenium voratum]|nr:unnamed protein product [Effrenium voratum]